MAKRRRRNLTYDPSLWILSPMSDRDVAEAHATWRRLVAPAWRDLLTALPLGDE